MAPAAPDSRMPRYFLAQRVIAGTMGTLFISRGDPLSTFAKIFSPRRRAELRLGEVTLAGAYNAQAIVCGHGGHPFALHTLAHIEVCHQGTIW